MYQYYACDLENVYLRNGWVLRLRNDGVLTIAVFNPALLQNTIATQILRAGDGFIEPAEKKFILKNLEGDFQLFSDDEKENFLSWRKSDVLSTMQVKDLKNLHDKHRGVQARHLDPNDPGTPKKYICDFDELRETWSVKVWGA